MRNFIAGFMWCLNITTVLFGVAYGYQAIQPKEKGYSAEYRARLDEIVKNVTPLSVADLGDME